MHLLDLLLPPALYLLVVCASPIGHENDRSPMVAHDCSGSSNSVQTLSKNNDDPLAKRPEKLHGQFLHITDIHPDPWYKPKGRVSTSCHRKKPHKELDQGGYWGAPRTENCDSPLKLVNLTLQWLKDEWADKVDFVIWTGDSARHDNDIKQPRTASEVYDLNRLMVGHMKDIFTSRRIPVIPSLGNNDLASHNMMQPGPNEITEEFLQIWSSFIPFSSHSFFERGAYFVVEIVPNQLAAISMNTLYWYNSNKAIGGCRPNSEDPGKLELDWLELQLDGFRKRKMQVWLTGHVPPTMGNYFLDCYLGYARLALRFQDTIVGHLFGHMNVDHFYWLDAHELHNPPEEQEGASPLLSISNIKQSFWSFLTSSLPYKPEKKKRYSLSKTLRKDFRSLPPHKNPPNETGIKINYDDYAVVNVGPSVVPTFLPSVRVFRYNVTEWTAKAEVLGEEGMSELDGLGGQVLNGEEEVPVVVKDDEEDLDLDDDDEDDEDDEDEEFDDEEVKKKKKGSKRHHGHRHDPNRIDCTLKKNREKDECVFKKPRHASKHSPSRSNRLWSPLGYAQFYLTDMETSNKTHPPKFEIEYMTYPLSSVVPANDWPVPQQYLPESLHGLEEIPDGVKLDIAPFELEDLTIPKWIKHARRLAKKKRLWKRFKSFMYLGSEEP